MPDDLQTVARGYFLILFWVLLGGVCVQCGIVFFFAFFLIHAENNNHRAVGRAHNCFWFGCIALALPQKHCGTVNLSILSVWKRSWVVLCKRRWVRQKNAWKMRNELVNLIWQSRDSLRSCPRTANDFRWSGTVPGVPECGPFPAWTKPERRSAQSRTPRTIWAARRGFDWRCF